MATGGKTAGCSAANLPNPVIRLDGVDLAPGAAGGDPRLDDHRSLTDAQLRRRRDAEQGMYLAESPLVVRRAVAARSVGAMRQSTWLSRVRGRWWRSTT